MNPLWLVQCGVEMEMVVVGVVDGCASSICIEESLASGCLGELLVMGQVWCDIQQQGELRWFRDSLKDGIKELYKLSYQTRANAKFLPSSPVLTIYVLVG